MQLPQTTKLKLELKNGFLHATMNDPQMRNALSDELVADFNSLCDVLEQPEGRAAVRAVILRGDSKAFSAGANLKNLSQSQQAGDDATAQDSVKRMNRSFGEFLLRFSRLPQVVIGVVEGAAFGGGMGLVCGTDIAICYRSARFALSETGLGLPPAQIAPFVAMRIGLTQTRLLALAGLRFDGARAHELGIAHYLVENADEEAEVLSELLTGIGRCAPNANARTKQILFDSVGNLPPEVLDRAADAFVACVNDEAREGVQAFLEKRPAAWVIKP